MAEFAKGAGTLEGVAGRLRGSAHELEGAATSPPSPDAGVCTGAVLAALNFLAESAAGVSEGLSAMGDSVAEGDIAFDDNEQRTKDELRPRGPK